MADMVALIHISPFGDFVYSLDGCNAVVYGPPLLTRCPQHGKSTSCYIHEVTIREHRTCEYDPCWDGVIWPLFMIKILRRKQEEVNTNAIEEQLEEYIKWRAAKSKGSFSQDARWMIAFVRQTGVTDINDVRLSHIRSFSEYMRKELGAGQFRTEAALRDICSVLSYFHSRGYTCPGRGAWRK